MVYREGGSGGYIPQELSDRMPGAAWPGGDGQDIDQERMMIAALNVICGIEKNGFSDDRGERLRQEGLVMLACLCGEPPMTYEEVYKSAEDVSRVYRFN